MNRRGELSSGVIVVVADGAIAPLVARVGRGRPRCCLARLEAPEGTPRARSHFGPRRPSMTRRRPRHGRRSRTCLVVAVHESDWVWTLRFQEPLWRVNRRSARAKPPGRHASALVSASRAGNRAQTMSPIELPMSTTAGAKPHSRMNVVTISTRSVHLASLGIGRCGSTIGRAPRRSWNRRTVWPPGCERIPQCSVRFPGARDSSRGPCRFADSCGWQPADVARR